ncbi:serine/threonine protein kinase [Streptomyces sp. HC44]|uniref:Serine/threonine protein kinase n=2 Tax=Streptomyces scabichelini TaxID=2711217 RepID=A0A6G4V2Y8_9ACTN|nr:serine/threonine protein kinase [Streptomyces scabichelini]NGO08438.1 serine/threonine protein kinase [Streptomyces scabichelini]
MVAELAGATTPGVRMIAANPGDWGVDAFAGDLGGEITVWQSKYFWPTTDKNQQQQIRDSLKSVLATAAKKAHTVKMWILCIPSSMDGPTAAWWDSWKKRQEREHNIVIDLWDEIRLTRQLRTPEADDVRRGYYEVYRTDPQTGEPRDLVEVDDDKAAALESALFIMQMKEAGHVEFDSAKRQFFNADVVAREIAHKGVPAELKALTSTDATLHGLWEARFNQCWAEDKFPSLHASVWSDVRTEHPQLPQILRLDLPHAWGLVHRLVDNRKAGWVKHWRSVAAAHPDP